MEPFHITYSDTMTEAEIQESVSSYEEQLRQWVASHQGQLDAYEYERSFVEFTEKLARETFARAVAGKAKSRNTPKK